MNEPRIGESLPLDTLLKYYDQGSIAIREANPKSTINVTIHGGLDVYRKSKQTANVSNEDAFQPLSAWEARGSVSNISSLPTTNLSLDTHQYYAYYPHGNLSQSQMLDLICSTSKQLKTKLSKSKLPPVIVGEWSLAQSMYFDLLPDWPGHRLKLSIRFLINPKAVHYQ